MGEGPSGVGGHPCKFCGIIRKWWFQRGLPRVLLKDKSIHTVSLTPEIFYRIDIWVLLTTWPKCWLIVSCKDISGFLQARNQHARALRPLLFFWDWLIICEMGYVNSVICHNLCCSQDHENSNTNKDIDVSWCFPVFSFWRNWGGQISAANCNHHSAQYIPFSSYHVVDGFEYPVTSCSNNNPIFLIRVIPVCLSRSYLGLVSTWNLPPMGPDKIP